ncbi:MAG: hypothetical protein BA863_10385 [Desulfovibrio sp. S3730MH75]|nr:MAG: hypothetical protein BA863_10385 [Desulfovibrio sp. S3730MH75]
MESSLVEWLEEMVRGCEGGWCMKIPTAEVFKHRAEQARELEFQRDEATRNHSFGPRVFSNEAKLAEMRAHLDSYNSDAISPQDWTADIVHEFYAGFERILNREKGK